MSFLQKSQLNLWNHRYKLLFFDVIYVAHDEVSGLFNEK